jgi:hypothetical protein
MTAWFLGINRGGSVDENTRRMHTALRTRAEQYVFGGASIGGLLGQLDGTFEDPACSELAAQIRAVMLTDPSFVERVWNVMRHNRFTLDVMPGDGPWVDASRVQQPRTNS